jgi:hypothetical protein
VTATADKLGEVYAGASTLERAVGLVLVFAALILFAASVLALLISIAPYQPLAVDAALGGDTRRVYFPNLHELSSAEPAVGTPAWFRRRLTGSPLPSGRRSAAALAQAVAAPAPLLEAMKERLEPMTSVEINRELMAEVLKLKDCLDWEARWAQLGYRLLRYELLAISAFFALLVAVAV